MTAMRHSQMICSGLSPLWSVEAVVNVFVTFPYKFIQMQHFYSVDSGGCTDIYGQWTLTSFKNISLNKTMSMAENKAG